MSESSDIAKKKAEIDKIKEEINTKTDDEELKKLKAKLRAKEKAYKSSLEEYEEEFSEDAAVVHVYFKVYPS